MSADNYYFVSKTEEGKYAVSHRFASVYYADEFDPGEAPMEGYSFKGGKAGWSIRGDSANAGRIFPTLDEAVAAATRRPDWIEPPPIPRSTHPTLEAAVMQAHLYVHQDSMNGIPVEYSVCIQTGLIQQEDYGL